MSADAQRNPWAAPTPLDWASFYVESLKYGPGPGKVERVGMEEMVAQLEVLLRDAGIQTMTGQELLDAADFYCVSLARTFRVSLILTRSCFTDGLMHGIAFAAGLHGEHRDAPEAVS